MSAFLKIALPLALLTSCAAAKERTISIEARPALQEGYGGSKQLSAQQGGIVVYSTWPAEAPKLDQKRTYRFELVQEYRPHSPGTTDKIPVGFWTSRLVKVFEGDRLVYDASICPVHHRQMTLQAVPISYGLPSFSNEYQKARDTRFPHANSYVLGGCSVGPEKNARVFRCKDCIGEEKAWEARNAPR